MLLELMHGYTSDVLKDALIYSRMRQLRRRPPAVPGAMGETVELSDTELAVRGRTSHGWTRPLPREVVAQQAADVNSEPMPLLQRRCGALSSRRAEVGAP